MILTIVFIVATLVMTYMYIAERRKHEKLRRNISNILASSKENRLGTLDYSYLNRFRKDA